MPPRITQVACMGYAEFVHMAILLTMTAYRGWTNTSAMPNDVTTGTHNYGAKIVMMSDFTAT